MFISAHPIAKSKPIETKVTATDMKSEGPNAMTEGPSAMTLQFPHLQKSAVPMETQLVEKVSGDVGKSSEINLLDGGGLESRPEGETPLTTEEGLRPEASLEVPHSSKNVDLMLSSEVLPVAGPVEFEKGPFAEADHTRSEIPVPFEERPSTAAFHTSHDQFFPIEKEPFFAPPNASPDINELEEALKQLASISREVKDSATSSESVSFFGDYRERKNSVDGAVKRKRKRGDSMGPTKDHHPTRVPKSSNSSSDEDLPPSLVDSEVIRAGDESDESVQHLDDSSSSDSNEIVPPPLEERCTAIECNFEKGDLCSFVSSTPHKVQNHRSKRALTTLPFFIIQRWGNWIGKFNKSYRRVDRAPVFSPSNRHFAATLLRGQQMATLTIQTTTLEPFLVGFDSWEATRDMQMRVCCDDVCPLTTNSGYRMGDRSWQRLATQCPATTRTLSFECMNFGKRRGACGIDNFMMRSKSCFQ
ncbi:hypothetical protein GCK32_001174 [Trichostrongylus colubriformis]|uniref:Uncharacterized protein n=1 Tax=Trichostrongylus colubriformis TaxID=6319 RepID=A0AAN8IIS7_TRICO